ncbi:MAG TPA: prolipoprotein diacylglyceryl transferase [Polyangia bacterium]|nr:prolipoprotein diacylglyceryl transferase [Polyangia bacterium]
MRPILLKIPTMPLLIAALLVAGIAIVRDTVWRKRKGLKMAFPSTALWALVGVALLIKCIGKYGDDGANVVANLKDGFVPIYAYGVMLGTSLVIGWFIAMNLAGKDGIDQQEAGTIYMWTAVWSIIGSRLLWYFTTPKATIAEIPMVNQGGLVAYGGMIGGFLASVYCCRRRGIPLLQWADVAAPSVVLGTAITRIGCFLFGCDYGARSSAPWAVQFPGPNAHKFLGIIKGGPDGSPAWQHHYGQLLTECVKSGTCWSDKVHPTQLYESLVGLSLFGLLMLIRRYRTFSGQVFLGWVIGYGVLRSLIERYRDDADRGVYNIFGDVTLSTSQIIGIVSVVLGLGLFVALLRKYRRDPASLRLWEHVPAPAKVEAQAKTKGEEGGGGKRRKRR